MDRENLDYFMESHRKYFPEDKLLLIKSKLNRISENRFLVLTTIKFKDPIVVFIVSLFFGFFGIDRFMIGDTGMGIFKLLTGGGFGIAVIIDWFTIIKKTKEYNYRKLLEYLI